MPAISYSWLENEADDELFLELFAALPLLAEPEAPAPAAHHSLGSTPARLDGIFAYLRYHSCRQVSRGHAQPLVGVAQQVEDVPAPFRAQVILFHQERHQLGSDYRHIILLIFHELFHPIRKPVRKVIQLKRVLVLPIHASHGHHCRVPHHAVLIAQRPSQVLEVGRAKKRPRVQPHPRPERAHKPSPESPRPRP